MAPIFFDYPRNEMGKKRVKIALSTFETYLKKDNTKYAAGDHVTIADFCLISATMCLEGIDFDFSEFPTVKKWYSTFKKEQPEFWALTEEFMKWVKHFEQNPPDMSKMNHPIHPKKK